MKVRNHCIEIDKQFDMLSFLNVNMTLFLVTNVFVGKCVFT